MKRILIWLLIFAMVLSFPIVSLADSEGQTIYGQVINGVDLAPGNTFSYNVSIRENQGFITGAVTVSWPEEDFKLTRYAIGSIAPNNGTGAVEMADSGSFTVALGDDYKTQNYTENGVLFTLTFEILDTATEGSKTISLGMESADGIFVNADLEGVPTMFEPGSIDLVRAEEQVIFGDQLNNVRMVAGEQFDYNVCIRNNQGFIAGAFKISWPENSFKMLRYSIGSVAPNNGTQSAGSVSGNTLTVDLGDDCAGENYSDDGVLITFTFEVLDTASEGRQAITVAKRAEHDSFLDYDLQEVPTSYESGFVDLIAVGRQTVYGDQVNDVRLIAGEEFTYDVAIRDNQGFVAGSIQINWLKTAFKLKGYSMGFVPDNDTKAIELFGDGTFIVSFGDDEAEEDYTKDGVLFSLTFEVLDTAAEGQTAISLSPMPEGGSFINNNLDEVPTTFENGYVKLDAVDPQTVYGEQLQGVELVPGEQFTYGVSIRNNLGIATGTVKVTWPKNDFTLKAFEVNSQLKDQDTAAIGPDTDGVFTVAFGNDEAKENYTEDEVLFTLTFEIADTATLGEKEIGLAFQNNADDFLNCNMGTVPTVFENGSVTIIEVQGAAISGTAASWNDTDNAVYLLYKGGISDNDIRTEWRNGTYVDSDNVMATGTGESITAGTVADNLMYLQPFTFEKIEAGAYKLVAFKPEGYAPYITELVVTDEDIALGTFRLMLYGDVNADRKVNMDDVLLLARHAFGVETFSYVFKDNIERINEALSASNVNGDNDINMADVISLARFATGVSDTFD